MPDTKAKIEELNASIAALEAQRAVLGDSVVDSAVTALKRQLEELTQPAPAEAPAHTEERKLVTIVFVDISGFTALAEKLDPEEVRGLINACFEQLVPIVQKYGGTVDKFIGDEIMALFGAPVAHENDPERALRSGLEMMEAITLFNQEHHTALGLHIGVNTGPVVTGAVGSQHRREYSVMGDAVNLAARLEDASADGEIYVGPNTYRLTVPLFDFEPTAPLTLKGKTEPLAAYRLIGLKSTPKPIRGIEGLRSELVGRDNELDQVHAAIGNLRSGRGGVVAVVGEAGLGKSRLVSEVFSTLPGDVSRFEGRALSHTTGMSHWMARDILRALLGSSATAPTEEIAMTLSKSIETIAPTNFDETYPYLATLLQLPLEQKIQEQVKLLSTEALHGRMLYAFRDYVSHRARQDRLILFWEDLHWCDPSSLRVVETLLPVTNEAPLLLLLAYRPEEEMTQAVQRQAQTIAGDNFHLVELSPLDRQQSGSLVEALLRIENLPARMQDLILDRAEGNPFFIEELLRSLLDSGAIAVENARVVALAEIEQARVPETVEGVLTARMDRLNVGEKHTLQTAAVIGRMFQRDVLEHVHRGHNGADLDNCLSELEKRDFIHPVKQGFKTNGEYMFKHAITQDVAYHALLKAHRKQVHQQVAEALEILFSNRLAEVWATLAYHYERAELAEKAFHYLTRAGEHAQATFANTEAEAFYRSAIRQADLLLKENKDPQVVHALTHVRESLGDVLQLAGRADEARAIHTESLTLLPESDRILRSRLYRKIGFAFTLRRNFAAMAEAFDAADRELGDQPIEPETEWWHEKVQVLLEQMHLFYWEGMSDKMMRLAERYGPAIEQRGTPGQRGRFFQRLGLSHLTGDRYVASEEAVRLAELAVSTCTEATDLDQAAHIQFTAGLTHLFKGNLRQAIDYCRQALTLAERVGDLVGQARCLTYLAVAYRRSSDKENTLVYADRTLTLATRLGMVEYVAMAKANLAWLAWREGRLSDAGSLGSEALNLWHGMEDPYGFDWLAILPLVAVSLAEERFQAAIDYTGALFRENQHPVPTPLTTAAKKAIAAAEHDGSAAAKQQLKQMIEVAEEIGYL